MSGLGPCILRDASKTPNNPITLNNFLSSENVLFDTLHSKSTEIGHPCTDTLCQGALVMPELGKCARDPSTVDMAEMEQFYTEYYAQLDDTAVTLKEDMQKRLEEIREAVKTHGHYIMSTDELLFATKTAWRNASRCIGRIQWSKLKLFDGRHIQSTQEMFQIICEHLEYGTNEGNIRSAVSVFPCRQSRAQVRIWNSEFISYAGFEVEPGVIVGDPNHVDLTKICLQLGWNPKREKFQILPLVIQYGDNNPDIYIIPEKLCLEVPITHPQYPGLADLNLKWFAVPGVSNMGMDCGGQFHMATGFNGWYMSTEIVRDLCDTSRYNMLPEIAESMGFDVSKPAVFWKDSAATELNIAIVTSFQANNVTITDHHTASDTFMHHLETEQTLRGGCPADWVWINPPLGGHLTSVFHQEMMNYKLKPSYEYQKKPWVGFQWKGDLRKGNVRKEKLTLRSVARALTVCCRLMKSAMRNKKQCTILYATETGQSERCAYKLQRQFEQNYNVEVYRMDKYDTKLLRNESLLLLVTSTFGNGEAPDTGKTFEKFLIDTAKERKSMPWSVAPSEDITPTRFAVFGLGSSAYPNYCSFSMHVDELLSEIGLKRLLDIHTGDEQKNQETAFRNWSSRIYSVSCQMHGITLRRSFGSQTSRSEFDQNKDIYHLVPSNKSPTDVHEGLTNIHSKSVAICETVSVESLITDGEESESISASGVTCDTVLVKLRHTGIKYEPGDHLAVYPSNLRENVDVLCKSCIFDSGVDKNTVVSIKTKANEKRISMGRQRLPSCSLASALTNYLDIEATPRQSDLENILAICNCSDEEMKQLRLITTKEHEYDLWVESKPSWVDFLKGFPSLRIPACYFLTELALLTPRYYSISSSPLACPDEVHLTLTVLEYSVGKAGEERQKFGLCSNYLKNLTKGQTVQTFVRRCKIFYLPSPSQDIIMIGAGSGVAPFRSFWQHKRYIAAHPTSDDVSLRFSQGDGMVYLFQGFRTRSQTLHKEELDNVVADRTIEAMFTALSREKDIAKMYVQDKLTQHSELVYNLLMNKKAHLYVCGDIKMATGVSEALKAILTTHREHRAPPAIEKVESNSSLSGIDSGISDTSSVDGADILDHIREEGRYHEDIFSILV